MEPTQEPNNDATYPLFAFIENSGKIYADQTGRFPVTPSKGSKYILLIYDYDSNAILDKPIKNRMATEILRAYTKLVTYLKNRGFRPQKSTGSTIMKHRSSSKHSVMTMTLDFNLCRPTCIDTIQQSERFELVRNWKNHFVAGLCSTDSQFPTMHQATLTLSLLRPSRCNPQGSAYTTLENTFDFNKTPMATPHTKVIIHWCLLLRSQAARV